MPLFCCTRIVKGVRMIYSASLEKRSNYMRNNKYKKNNAFCGTFYDILYNIKVLDWLNPKR